MLAPVTPVWAVRDLFLAMGLGAWLCVGYTLLLRLARRAGGPLARLAGVWRRAAQSRLAVAHKNRAGKRRRPAVHKKPGQPPTKQLQKRARVLYNSE